MNLDGFSSKLWKLKFSIPRGKPIILEVGSLASSFMTPNWLQLWCIRLLHSLIVYIYHWSPRLYILTWMCQAPGPNLWVDSDNPHKRGRGTISIERRKATPRLLLVSVTMSKLLMRTSSRTWDMWYLTMENLINKLIRQSDTLTLTFKSWLPCSWIWGP